ncbi:MAG: hypothetical protein HY868_08015 [Chloroflexi bacterium]|nr:hypothetical protein [Chloroflexota bacterium]
MQETVTLNEVLDLVARLSPRDQVRLIERVAPQIERDLSRTRTRASRKSLRGLWRGLDITEEEIAQARREMWASFPREDI